MGKKPSPIRKLFEVVLIDKDEKKVLKILNEAEENDLKELLKVKNSNVDVDGVGYCSESIKLQYKCSLDLKKKKPDEQTVQCHAIIAVSCCDCA